MKKIFFTFTFMLIGTFVFSNNTKLKIEFQNSSIINLNGVKFSKSSFKEDVKFFDNNFTNSSLCTVTCQINVGGVLFTASAGNFLSSCERAGRRCAEKLGQAVGQFLETAPQESTPEYYNF
jgi:hypothetical protein